MFKSDASFAFLICLVILCGHSLAVFWRPTLPAPNSNYYATFQTVPAAAVTAAKLMTNFLHIWPSSNGKRQSINEDIVIVLDKSGSVGSCEFKKAKKALSLMIEKAHSPGYDSKYAAVSFATSATIDFQFLPHTSAATQLLNIVYSGGGTNTQAGLQEANNLFNNPNSGHRINALKRVFLVTDGHSNIQASQTLIKAQALKNSGVSVYVIAVGSFIGGIDEMVRVASIPPEYFLFRITNMQGFLDIIGLVIQQINPGQYAIDVSNGQYNTHC